MNDRELERRLEDLQRSQDAVRRKVFGQWELDELKAFQRLAHAAFGDRGVVELNAPTVGRVSIGYTTARKRPGRPTPTRRVFTGTTHAELDAQIRLWKASQ